MALIFNKTQSLINDSYDYYLWTLTLSDTRTKGWLLVDSPIPTFVLTLAYFLTVFIGPKLMKNKKPFSLTWLLVPYNFSMACLNAYISVQLFTASYRLNYSYFCESCRSVHSPDEIQIAKAIWWYYFSKLIEFSDTIFFILRKKDRQLTFLHVYHHSTMFILWWIGVKWVPGGSSFLPAMINSLVHVIMYAYYGLSACGSKIQKYLWWKKYLTMIQLIQFSVALFMGMNGIRIRCDFPLWMHYALVLYMMSFLMLFGNFYVHAYIAGGKKRRRELLLKKEQLKFTNNHHQNGSIKFD